METMDIRHVIQSLLISYEPWRLVEMLEREAMRLAETSAGHPGCLEPSYSDLIGMANTYRRLGQILLHMGGHERHGEPWVDTSMAYVS